MDPLDEAQCKDKLLREPFFCSPLHVSITPRETEKERGEKDRERESLQLYPFSSTSSCLTSGSLQLSSYNPLPA